MLNPEFHDFYNRWRAKANDYQGEDIHTAFDRFFTLFVIYNRLYAEATFDLVRNNQEHLDPRRSFPDGTAAKRYVGKYLGKANLIHSLEEDRPCAEAIQAVMRLLAGPVDGRQFAIVLHKIDGSPQRGEDQRLLQKFSSRSDDVRAEAVLEFLYAVRVNLFHGHKTFHPVQLVVMKPANVLLLRTIDILFERLNRP